MATGQVKIVRRLPPLPSIRDIIKMYNLKALRQLSQNFLMDHNLNNKIVKCCGRIKGFEICEVGPGPGNLTRAILNKSVEKVILIEKDSRFLPSLEMLREAAPDAVKIISGDVLSFDMANLFDENKRTAWESHYPRVQLIGNLPFNISTPLIIKWLRAISEHKSAWSYGRVRMTLTFQKEVAERMQASIMSAQRCRLSVMCQNWCEIEQKFIIPGRAFLPKPKVDVSVVHLKPRIEPIIPLPFDLIEKVIGAIFRYRQKHVLRGIETLFPAPLNEKLAPEMLQAADIPFDNRSFQLSLPEISKICYAYKKIIDKSPVLYKYKHSSKDVDWLDKESQAAMKLEEFKNRLAEEEFY